MTGQTANFVDYLFLLLQQFAGGPGPPENNLMRFGVPTAMWAVLIAIAWQRQRGGNHPRERLLLWGFGFGFLREAFMFLHVSLRITHPEVHETHAFLALEPLEHALALVSVVVIAGAFIRYILDDRKRGETYLAVGLAVTALSYLVTAPWWSRTVRALPGLQFHQTWTAWIFHIAAAALITAALALIRRRRGWLRNTVALALLFFLLGEVIILANFATQRRYAHRICPIGNTLHILAVPILGYVYLREQGLEKRRAEQGLAAYRDHLEELVAARTAELTDTNRKLVQEVVERRRAEASLTELSDRHEMILNAAGEGIFGVDLEGRHTFVNRAAARMLGYDVTELVGEPSHTTWHHLRPDGSPYPEAECPLHAGYRTGAVRRGEDQLFWRKDGTAFPARYVSTPIRHDGALRGAVVIFQDISDEQAAAAEIADRTSELAVQATLAATISRSLDLDTILNTALETIVQALDAEAACIYLAEDGEPLPVPRAFRDRRGAGPAAHRRWADLPCNDIIARALAERSPTRLDHWVEVQGMGPLALIGVPLIAKDSAVGALAFAVRAGNHDLQHPDHLTAIGQQIGVAVDNARLYLETQRWAEELAALHQASVHLSTTWELTELCPQISREVMTLLGCSSALIVIPDDAAEGAIRIHTAQAVAGDHTTPAITPQDRAWLGHLTRESLPLVIAGDAETDDAAASSALPASRRERWGVRALLGLPLRNTDHALGYLLAMRATPARWRGDEIELAESFADLAALVLAKAQLHYQAERAAALEERHRIAGDVHDSLAQTLSYLGHHVDGLIESAGRGDAAQVIASSEIMRGVLDETSQQVRQLIRSLSAKPAPPKSLQALLQETLAQAASLGAPALSFHTDLQAPIHLPLEITTQVLRVAQEALANAEKHARARHVRLTLAQEAEALVMTVSDDGLGFDPTRSATGGSDHFGLSIMRARAARIAGQLTVQSAPDQGTRVILRWPITDVRGEHPPSAGAAVEAETALMDEVR